MGLRTALVLLLFVGCRSSEKPSPDVAPAKTVMTEKGEAIDCVDIYEQPAFGHPVMKSHALQLMPSSVLGRDIDRDDNVSYKLSDPCPPGTVPIPRVQKRDLMMDRSRSSVGSDLNVSTTEFSLSEDLHVSLPKVDFSRIFWADGADPVEHGGGAALNTLNLSVARDRFTSLGLVVQGGADGGQSAISAGWMVDQRGLTRFFTYWSVDHLLLKQEDNYTDGCYNLDCPGFVETSSEIAIDAVVSRRFSVQVIISQDPLTRHWWLAYDGNFVGYWPNELFGRHLYNGASRMDCVETTAK